MVSFVPGKGLNWIARLRLASGLVLFAYVATHLTNHAFGIVSLDAAQTANAYFFEPLWRNPVGTLLLYGGLVVHISLVAWSIFRRRTWRGMRPGEIAQLLLGISIPPLLTVHVVATRGLHEMYGLSDGYGWVMAGSWAEGGWPALRQALVVLVVWGHGCIGVHYWLRLKPWYVRATPYLYTAAVLLPALALFGFVSAGREFASLAQDPAWREAFWQRVNLQPGAREWYAETSSDILRGMAGLLAGALLARYVGILAQRRRGMVTLTYPMGRKVTLAPGALSVLEASRANGIPHASVCGGRGRCSTCRVRVGAGAESLAEPSGEEVRVLQRVGAPPNVRLACQIRPTADLSLTPLLPPGATPREAWGRPDYHQGQEREIAILFADLRAFTQFSERKLPYDVVFVLNEYFRVMGQAVEAAGGRIDKFIGDGVMALFGLDTTPEQAARDALAAARGMALAIGHLNETLAHDLERPLRFGIGIHCGAAIVGEMGFGRSVSITAVGDTVNIASRLEGATKDYDAELVLSQDVALLAGYDFRGVREERIAVRGRAEMLAIHVLAQASSLPGVDEPG